MIKASTKRKRMMLLVSRWRVLFFGLAVALCRQDSAAAFTIPVGRIPGARHSTSLLQVAAATKGMGMGMSKTSTKKTKKNGKNKKAKGTGNGSSSSSKKGTAFDANASLLKLEKKYDELIQKSNKALHSDDDGADSHLASELVVTVRAVPSKSAATADWVPIAQLCLHPHSEVASPFIQAAVSMHCRELAVAAGLGSSLFATVPRQDLQYAVEPVESFYKHVYDPIMEQSASSSQSAAKGNNQNDNSLNDSLLQSMTKAEARDILQLINGEADDKTAIKQAYRKKSFQWHPDRLASDLTATEKSEAAHEYAKVQKAFDVLSSGVRAAGTSWYASLGGRDRTEFLPLQLQSQDTAAVLLRKYRVQAAVVGLDSSVVQAFVARNQAAGATATAN